MAPNGYCEITPYYETVNTYVISGTFDYEVIEQKHGYEIPASIKRKNFKGFPDSRSFLLKRQASGKTGK